MPELGVETLSKRDDYRFGGRWRARQYDVLAQQRANAEAAAFVDRMARIDLTAHRVARAMATDALQAMEPNRRDKGGAPGAGPDHTCDRQQLKPGG